MKPYYDQDGITIYHGDARDILPILESDSVDLVLTDPPYFRVKGEPWDRQWKNRDAFLAWIGSLCDEWRRVLKPNGTLAVFASPDMTWFVEREVRERFNVLNTMRWVKDAGWHNKAKREELRSFLSPWESIILAEQYAGEDTVAEAALYEYKTALRLLHQRVFAPLGQYFREERERSGLTRNDVEVALGFTSSDDPTRGTALYTRWEEGSQIPPPPTYERLRTVLNTSGANCLRRDHDELRREWKRLRQEYDREAADLEPLRREYEDLRRPFSLKPGDAASDIVSFRTVAPDYQKHPCEKPIALMEYIIRATTKPGALVLDCFVGSGATTEAARNLERRAIGIDSTERYCAEAVSRIQQAVLPLGGIA